MRALALLLVRLLNRTPFMRWFRQARRFRDQYVDPQVRQLRAAARQIERGGVDILYLGDSSSTFFGADETDQRRLPHMLADELGGANIAFIASAGANPALNAEYVRLLATLPQRPRAVVVSTAIRTSYATHVRQHPMYGYHRSMATLRAAADLHHRIPAFSRLNRHTPEQFDAFHALAVSTRWDRARTVGGFLDQVRGRRSGPEVLERQQVLFDYFHGQLLDPNDPAIDDFRALGRALAAYGVPVVNYWPPVPLERGERYFPGEFEATVRAAYAPLKNALDGAVGDRYVLAEGPFGSSDDEFIDSSDGSEHWNTAGRRRIAKVLADAFREVTEGA